MSVDDLPPASACTPPFYRTGQGRIELVVPRPGGSADVHPIPLGVALVHIEDLAAAIRRHPDRASISLGREPA